MKTARERRDPEPTPRGTVPRRARNAPLRHDPDAIELLRAQHAEIDALVVRIQRTTDLVDRRAATLELAELLRAHIRLEEGILYPAMLARQTEQAVLERLEEHLQIKQLVAELLALAVDDPEFDATLGVLVAAHRDHDHPRDGDDRGLLAHVARLFGAEELVRLGREMLALYDSLRRPLGAAASC